MRHVLFALAAVLLSSACAGAVGTVRSDAPPAFDRRYVLAEEHLAFRVPHPAWHAANREEGEFLSLRYERIDARIAFRSVPLDGRSFPRVVDDVRGECIRRGESVMESPRFMLDRDGRQAAFRVRRTGGADTEEGTVTVVLFSGRPDAIVVTGWWPESPMGWPADDYKEIIGSLHTLREP